MIKIFFKLNIDFRGREGETGWGRQQIRILRQSGHEIKAENFSYVFLVPNALFSFELPFYRDKM